MSNFKAPVHIKDTILTSITFEDVIIALQSNEKEINSQTIITTYQSMLKDAVRDGQHELMSNLKFISDSAKI